MSNIFHLWLHVLQVTRNTLHRWKNVIVPYAAYVLWSNVRFVLDSLYTNGKTMNVTYTEINTGRLRNAFCCVFTQ
jgi:hypothetical protein